ncbi:STAS domain-containing protein [Cryptosporangium sp. NPDC048952]|uniref:STAS domain-containing protein n=1 Tax=Cryptosporangium sp. NPDC048952 TaxID=3363961 RepID=UPI003718E83C
MTALTITATTTAEAQIFTLAGVLDTDTLGEYHDAIYRALRRSPSPTLVVLDLSALGFVSAAGGRALHSFAADLRRTGIDLHLVVDRESFLSRILDLLDAEQRFVRFSTLEEATTRAD